MIDVKEAADEFLPQRRIAVTGVTRVPGSHGGNVVYRPRRSECAALGISRVWMHRSIGEGLRHRFMGFFLTRTGKVPRTV